MSDTKSQLQNAGRSELHTKNGGSSGSHLSMTFAKRVFLGDALRPLRSEDS